MAVGYFYKAGKCWDCTKLWEDRLLRFEGMVNAYFEHQKAQYTQTMQCQMAQQAINVVTQQIQ